MMSQQPWLRKRDLQLGIVILVITFVWVIPFLESKLAGERPRAEEPSSLQRPSPSSQSADHGPARFDRQAAFIKALESEGLRVSIADNTLVVVVPDTWYDLRDHEKRRLAQMIAEGFAGARQQDGAEGSGVSYIFVDLKDRYGEKVASYSAWSGVHIRR